MCRYMYIRVLLTDKFLYFANRQLSVRSQT